MMHPTRHSRDYFKREAVNANVWKALLFAFMALTAGRDGDYVLTALAGAAAVLTVWWLLRLRKL